MSERNKDITPEEEKNQLLFLPQNTGSCQLIDLHAVFLRERQRGESGAFQTPSTFPGLLFEGKLLRDAVALSEMRIEHLKKHFDLRGLSSRRFAGIL